MASEKEPKAVVSCNPRPSRANRKPKAKCFRSIRSVRHGPGVDVDVGPHKATSNSSEVPAPSLPSLFPSTAVFRILEKFSGLQSFLAFQLAILTTSISSLPRVQRKNSKLRQMRWEYQYPNISDT